MKANFDGIPEVSLLFRIQSTGGGGLIDYYFHGRSLRPSQIYTIRNALDFLYYTTIYLRLAKTNRV